MSVDYRASYGIGYKICKSEYIETEDLEDGLEEYIDCECGEGFECFVTGSAYSGDITGTYFGIKEPFKDGLDLTAAKEALDKEVERLKLETESEFGLIGGLYVF